MNEMLFEMQLDESKKFIADHIHACVYNQDGSRVSDDEAEENINLFFSALAIAIGEFAGQFVMNTELFVGKMTMSLMDGIYGGEQERFNQQNDMEEGGEDGEHDCATCEDKDTCAVHIAQQEKEATTPTIQ